MEYPIVYQQKSRYDSLATGITIEATLRYGGRASICPAKIDTGAQVCLFARSQAELLEIPLADGQREVFSTLVGQLVAYGHEIELETLGLRFQTMVYFAEQSHIRRNLLGRQGWLQLVTLGLDDYQSELYLAANHELL